MSVQETDVLVIGGGPAGSTFSTLMAKRGWRVTLLEKTAHPRFHIGESLLPMNVPIFERLGVLGEIEAIGIVKRGADFTLSKAGTEHKTFHFNMALGSSPGHAFEVRRSEFDALLFRNSERFGVDAREQTCVKEVCRQPDGSHIVEASSANGEELRWRTRFLVDASGRDAFVARSKGWKKRNSKHASAAVFGHFRGVSRRPSEDAGNISIYWFEHGWVWMIPLPDDVMSIGAVCYPQYLKSRRGSLDEFLWETLEGIEEAKPRLKEAEPVMPAQATGNYSYAAKRPIGPGFMLIGDAFAFIDPVFSSGVYLAMSSAEHATHVAEAWLTDQKLRYRYESLIYQRRLRRGLAAFSWFIYRFTSPAMSQLLNNPRNVFKVVQAVISMLAGDVYSNPAVRRRLLVFKAIYYKACLSHWRSVRATRRRRQAGVGLDVA